MTDQDIQRFHAMVLENIDKGFESRLEYSKMKGQDFLFCVLTSNKEMASFLRDHTPDIGLSTVFMSGAEWRSSNNETILRAKVKNAERMLIKGATQ